MWYIHHEFWWVNGIITSLWDEFKVHKKEEGLTLWVKSRSTLKKQDEDEDNNVTLLERNFTNWSHSSTRKEIFCNETGGSYKENEKKEENEQKENSRRIKCNNVVVLVMFKPSMLILKRRKESYSLGQGVIKKLRGAKKKMKCTSTTTYHSTLL